MAMIYYRLVSKGVKTIDQVPEKFRAEVQALLDADNKWRAKLNLL